MKTSKRIHPAAFAMSAAMAIGSATCAQAHGAGASAEVQQPAAGVSTPTHTPAHTAASTGAQMPLAQADKRFVDKAAIGGMTEVQLGTIAQKNAASDQVKAFGARMVKDHTKANEELKQVASAKGIELPTALDSSHQKVVDKLGKLSGADFDKNYMKDMVSDHKEDVEDFSKAAKSAKDADVKGFAAKTLPVLQMHLQMAKTGEDTAKNGK